jgi:large subunit ribosomal protein L19
MTKKPIIQKMEKQQLKSDIPIFAVGDTVRVHTRITEGEKERVQMFMGTVIARKGTGLAETFSVHRVAYGEGMERVFPLHSPRIAQIEVLREGVVRQSKLYYLRGTSGKKAKVKSKIGGSRRAAVRNNGDKAPEQVQEEAEEIVEIKAEEVVIDNAVIETPTENDTAQATAQEKPTEPETEKADA